MSSYFIRKYRKLGLYTFSNSVDLSALLFYLYRAFCGKLHILPKNLMYIYVTLNPLPEEHVI